MVVYALVFLNPQRVIFPCRRRHREGRLLTRVLHGHSSFSRSSRSHCSGEGARGFVSCGVFASEGGAGVGRLRCKGNSEVHRGFCDLEEWDSIELG